MTKDEVIALARECDCLHVNLTGDFSKAVERLTRFAALVVANEREECALVSEAFHSTTPWPETIAEAIRARGNHD